ncbi:unnamed protein product [Brassica rapa subsp. trilocularis]
MLILRLFSMKEKDGYQPIPETVKPLEMNIRLLPLSVARKYIRPNKECPTEEYATELVGWLFAEKKKIILLCWNHRKHW